MTSIIFLLTLSICPYSATGLKMWAGETNGDLLFIVPVGPVSVPLIKQDINHLRTNYTGRVDVVLLHYDGLKKKWADKADGEWYSKNIQGSFLGAGGKFNLLQKYFQSRKEGMQKYDWIWAMDEDFDITKINIQSMIETATESGSKIVSPAVRFPTKHDEKKHKSLEKVTGKELEKVSSGVGCKKGDQTCAFQAGKDKCKYSRVNYVEVMMPMFRPEALSKILFECNHCIHEHSLWGLNSVWCKFVADKFDMKDGMNGCSLLDQHRAIKMVYHSLPSSYHSKDAQKDVKEHNPKYWVDKTKRKSHCVSM